MKKIVDAMRFNKATVKMMKTLAKEYNLSVKRVWFSWYVISDIDIQPVYLKYGTEWTLRNTFSGLVNNMEKTID